CCRVWVLRCVRCTAAMTWVYILHVVRIDGVEGHNVIMYRLNKGCAPMYLYQKRISEVARPDVLVVGSGAAGSVAAITAARLLQRLVPSAKVMLVERYGFLGGTSTAVLDTFYGFYAPGERPFKVVSGVPDDVITELRALD